MIIKIDEIIVWNHSIIETARRWPLQQRLVKQNAFLEKIFTHVNANKSQRCKVDAEAVADFIVSKILS